MNDLFASRPLTSGTSEPHTEINQPDCMTSKGLEHDEQLTFTPNKSKRAIFQIIRKKPKLKAIQMIESQLSENNSQTPAKKYNRKEKSLGELSRKLLLKYGRLDNCIIYLDKVTLDLGVERRRIYDVINIMESLKVIQRKGKNSYQWRGLNSIYQTLDELATKTEETEETEKLESHETQTDEKAYSKSKKEKSLALLSTGFLKLYLGWKSTISLDQAASKLSLKCEEGNQIKTKVRRLYDIANVFMSLGLIKKTLTEGRKPAFTWIGVTGLEQFMRRLNASDNEKEIFTSKPSKRSLMKMAKKQDDTVVKTPVQIIDSIEATPGNLATTATSQKQLMESQLFKLFVEFLQNRAMNQENSAAKEQLNLLHANPGAFDMQLGTQQVKQTLFDAAITTTPKGHPEDARKETLNGVIRKLDSQFTDNNDLKSTQKKEYRSCETEPGVKKKLFKTTILTCSQPLPSSQLSAETQEGKNVLNKGAGTQ